MANSILGALYLGLLTTGTGPATPADATLVQALPQPTCVQCGPATRCLAGPHCTQVGCGNACARVASAGVAGPVPVVNRPR